MKDITKHYIAAIVTFIPATDNSGERIRIKLPRFNKSRIIPFNYECSDILDVALQFLDENNCPVSGYADTGKSYTIFIDWQAMPAGGLAKTFRI